MRGPDALGHALEAPRSQMTAGLRKGVDGRGCKLEQIS
jgi:hypothetical protein